MKNKATGHMVIPIFVPHKGCPFDCIYCNQKSISGQMEEMTTDKMIETIETYLSTAGSNRSIEIGFYGGSFTGIEEEQQLGFLKAAHKYVKSGAIKAIRLSTRPDYITAEILDYLKDYGVGTIELGVQSLDEEVLSASCRGHNARDVINACNLIKSYDIELGIQTMIGLPGDTRQKALKTASKVVELAPSIVRIYPTLVIRGTYLQKLYSEGRYVPLSLDEAVDLSAELLDIYEKAGITVIRIGLQPTDEIREGGEVAAGPFHPAFRQLVESRSILHRLEKEIVDRKLSGKECITIKVQKRKMSDLIGQKKFNIDYLKEKYSIKSIEVVEDNFLSQAGLIWEIKNI